MKRVGEGLVTEAIPSFLLKTYEILEVLIFEFRIRSMQISSAGPKTAKDSS